MRITIIVLSGLLVATSAQAQGGGKIFTGKGNCFVCHGANAKGTPLAPDLTDTLWLNIDGSLEQIENLIKTGVPKPKKYPAPMPPMGGAKLSDEEVTAVARHVLMLSRRAALNRDAGDELNDRRYAKDDAGERGPVLGREGGAGAGCADGKGCKHCRNKPATPAIGQVDTHRHQQ